MSDSNTETGTIEIDWAAVTEVFGKFCDENLPLAVTLTNGTNVLNVVVPADKVSEFLEHLPLYEATVTTQ